MTNPKSYMLEDTDIRVIEKQSERMGNSSLSAALRVIIREWAEMKGLLPQPNPEPIQEPS